MQIESKLSVCWISYFSIETIFLRVLIILLEVQTDCLEAQQVTDVLLGL